MRKELEIQGLGPKTPFARAARAVIEHRVVNLLRHEPGVRAGDDIEALHDMRVFSRRLREALRIFEPCLNRKRFKSLFKRVRGITTALGEVRNLDVLIAYFEAMKKGDEDDSQAGLAVDDIMEWAARRRNGLRKIMLRELGHLHTDTLYYNTLELLAAPGRESGEGGEGAPVCADPLAAHADRLMKIRLDDTAAAWQSALDAPDEDKTATLHRLRIAFKKLRYALEILYAAFDREQLDAIYERVKSFQDILGDMHDADVFLMPVYARLKAAAAGDRMPVALGCAALAARLTKRRDRLIADFHTAATEYPITLLREQIEQSLIQVEPATPQQEPAPQVIQQTELQTEIEE